MASRVPPIFVAVPASSRELGARAQDRAELAAWGRELPPARAILVVSASWVEPALTRGTTARWPQALDVEGAAHPYPAPGAPELAADVARLLAPAASCRGWDRGLWEPLRDLRPEPVVPVLQLSLVAGAGPRRLFELGRRVGVLPSEGVLVVGTGAIVDAPAERAADPDAPPPSFARELDAWFANHLGDAAFDELFAWRRRAPNARRAHAPGGARIGPLFFVAGVASVDEHAVGFPVRGFLHGTFSRRCVQFGRG